MKPIRPPFSRNGGRIRCSGLLRNATQNKFFRIIDSKTQITKRTPFDKQLYQGL